MKSTDSFRQTIKAFLKEKATFDLLFREKLLNPNKKLDNCITYILNTVQKSGCNGFADDEIYGMALHYYDEENVDPGKPVDCNVVVNHHVELTQKEINEQKNKAKEKVMQDEMDRLKGKKTNPIKKEEPKVEPNSLF